MQATAQLAQLAGDGGSNGCRHVPHADYHDVIGSSGRADTCEHHESSQSGIDCMANAVHRAGLKCTAESAYTAYSAGLTCTTGSFPLVRHHNSQLWQDAALKDQGADACLSQSSCDDCAAPLPSKANSGACCAQLEAAYVNLPHSQQQLPDPELQHQERPAPSNVSHMTRIAALSEAGSPARAPQTKFPDRVHQQSQLPASRQPSSIFSSPSPDHDVYEVASSNFDNSELRVEGCPAATQQQVLKQYRVHGNVRAEPAQTMLQVQNPEPAQHHSTVG